MKKIPLLFLIASMVFILNAANYDRILVVDISGSMRRDNLHERVRGAFKEYVEKCRIGDRIILMTFGSDVNPGVEDRLIQSIQDIAVIKNKIDELTFSDQWTWMTKAFDIIFRRIEDLYRAYPEREKEIYIFTDGNNEPPPGHQDDFTFEEIINKYGEVVRRLGDEGKIFVYMVMFGVRPEERLGRFARETNIQIVEQPRAPSVTEEELIQKVALSITPLEFKSVLQDTIVENFKVKIKEIINVEKTDLRFEFPKEILISPSVIKILNGEIEKEEFKIEFKEPKPGLHKYTVDLKSDAKNIQVQPKRVVFKINIKKPIHIPVLAWLLPLIILFFTIAGVFYVRFICPKWSEEYFVVKKERIGESVIETLREKIKDYQRFCRGRVKSSDMEIQDVNFELRIDRNGKVYKKVIENGEEKEIEIFPGDNIIGNYYFEIREV